MITLLLEESQRCIFIALTRTRLLLDEMAGDAEQHALVALIWGCCAFWLTPRVSDT